MTQSSPKSRHPGRVISLANQKGGVGKTTTTVNLGAALALLGYKCLIIDMDPQGNASTGLGSYAMERQNTVYDALSGGCLLSDVIIPTPVDNLYLAPGSVDLSGLDTELHDDSGRATKLRSLLYERSSKPVHGEYDYVLIDCPPSLNLLTVNALSCSDALVIPLQSEFFALEGLTQLLSTVRTIQNGLNAGLRITGIVLTMYDHRNRLSRQVAEDVRENLSDITFKTMIPRNVRLSEAPSHGVPALVYDANCAGSRAYLDFALEFLQRDQAISGK